MSELDGMRAGLTKWCVWDHVEALLTDWRPAFDAYAKGATVHPFEGGFDRDKLPLPALSESFQNFVIGSFRRTVIVIWIADLFEIVLYRFEARV
jgi:hypothetical protein